MTSRTNPGSRPLGSTPRTPHTVTLTLPAPPAGLSANARRRNSHWTTRALTAEYRYWCWGKIPRTRTGDIAAGSFFKASAVVTLELCSGRRVPDIDGIGSLSKAAFDAIVDCQILPDDSPRHLVSVTYRAERHPKPCHCDGALVIALTEVLG